METTNKAASGGMGCLTIVGIIFLVLKLVGVEPVSNWSWIWVLSPFWIPFALIISLSVLAILAMKILRR